MLAPPIFLAAGGAWWTEVAAERRTRIVGVEAKYAGAVAGYLVADSGVLAEEKAGKRTPATSPAEHNELFGALTQKVSDALPQLPGLRFAKREVPAHPRLLFSGGLRGVVRRMIRPLFGVSGSAALRQSGCGHRSFQST